MRARRLCPPASQITFREKGNARNHRSTNGWRFEVHTTRSSSWVPMLSSARTQVAYFAEDACSARCTFIFPLHQSVEVCRVAARSSGSCSFAVASTAVIFNVQWRGQYTYTFFFFFEKTCIYSLTYTFSSRVHVRYVRTVAASRVHFHADVKCSLINLSDLTCVATCLLADTSRDRAGRRQCGLLLLYVRCACGVLYTIHTSYAGTFVWQQV